MNVSAIIVTRGDVSLKESMETIPEEWERLVWCNGSGLFRWKEDITGVDGKPTWQPFVEERQDLAVYGRYEAVQYASNDLIYVQDDDVIVSDPQAIVNEWDKVALRQEQDPAGVPSDEEWGRHIVCNMPQEFRHDFYTDHALVGFGAAFHRDAPERAFNRWLTWSGHRVHGTIPGFGPPEQGHRDFLIPLFMSTCDIIFTGLSDRVLVDVPKENLSWAYGDDRMWRQPEHQGERAQMRELMLAARKEIR